MDTKELEIRIKSIIEPLMNDIGMNIDSILVQKMQRRFLVKVFIEKESGVSLDDCADASREIGALLDVENLFPYSYTLEVSSPGLDRPLRNPADFKRFSGRTARVITARPIGNQTFFIGEIVEAGDNEVVLLLPKEKRVTIEYENISRARLVYDPPTARRVGR